MMVYICLYLPWWLVCLCMGNFRVFICQPSSSHWIYTYIYICNIITYIYIDIYRTCADAKEERIPIMISITRVENWFTLKTDQNRISIRSIEMFNGVCAWMCVCAMLHYCFHLLFTGNIRKANKSGYFVQYLLNSMRARILVFVVSVNSDIVPRICCS